MSTLLHRYSERDNLLSRLLEHADRLGRLQKALLPALPPQCAAACQVANLKDDVLVIKTAGSAVAVRLKQMLPSLLEHLARAGYPLRGIQIKVGLSEPAPERPRPEARILSETARSHISAFADALPPDDPLRVSLETLVRRGRG